MKEQEFLIKRFDLDKIPDLNRRQYFYLDELISLLKDYEKQLMLGGVGSSAWYCEISTINGRQWFEIVTGVNETEVAIKIEKAFGKGTKFEIKNEFKVM